MSKADRLSTLSRLRTFPRYMRDSEVSIVKKGTVIMMIAYILSPVDFIPELFIPLAGLLDDLGVLSLLTAWMYRELGKYKEDDE